MRLLTQFQAGCSLALSLAICTHGGADTLGYLVPRHSRDLASSSWGIQTSDDERLDLLEKAGAIGVKWTRLLINWSHVETKAGQYDFKDTDAMIDAALQAGIQPFVCFTGGNRLYSEAIPNPDPNWRLIYGVKPAPPILDANATGAWLRFVDAVIQRYRTRVTHWEIWNEPNHYAYWGAPPNAADYGRLVRVTAEKIRALQPGARIIAGALAGLDPKYITRFLAEDTSLAVDIVSFHNYANLPEARIYLADDTWAALHAHNPKLKLWQGECGYASASSTKDFRGTSPWGEMVQAKWLLRQAFVDTFFMRAELSNYFKLFDAGDRSAKQARPQQNPVDDLLGFPAEATGRRVRGVGVNEKCLLANPGLAPKPGYFAYQNLCALIPGDYVPAELKRRPIVTVTAAGQFFGIGENDDAYPSLPLVATYLNHQGAARVAYWLPWQPQEYTPKPATITLRLPGMEFKNPVLINLLDGSVHPLPTPQQDGTAAVFAGLPLFDFPLVIAERSTVNLITERPRPAHEAIPQF